MLTDAEIRSLKPRDKPFKRHDEKGLYIDVPVRGSKRWRFKYEFSGKEKLISLGTYPEVGLKAAREARDDARDKLRNGIDPSAHRQALKRSQARAGENSFEVVARAWWKEVHEKNVVPTHADRNLRRLELYVFPKIGRRVIGDIEPPDVLEVLRSIEAAGKSETAQRTKTIISQVCRYAIATGRASRDPTSDLKGMLATPETRHHPAITDPDELPALLRAIDGYGGYPPTVVALKLSTLIFVRPGELRSMEWDKIDFDQKTLDYQSSKRSGRRTGSKESERIRVLIPLPHQALEILLEMQSLSGHGRFVFPSARGKGRPMSENTVNAALHRMGYKDHMSAHGFRATARTILNERLHYDMQYIEMQLGHQVRDANGRAYNRATFLEQRREMLQVWADYLDDLRSRKA